MKIAPLRFRVVVWALLGAGGLAFTPKTWISQTLRRHTTELRARDDDPDGSFDNINDAPSTTSSRRRIILEGLSLASWLLMSNTPTAPAYAAADGAAPSKTIVITGSNSGVGLEATKRLAAEGHTIVLACRTLAKAQEAATKVSEFTSNKGRLIPAECDLASLASIQAFANGLPELLLGSSNNNDAAQIDALCLNAGIARNTAATDCARTKDGFELTVGINHFGHFYLNSLLLPRINPTNGKIVVTASSVHDPDGPGGAQGVPATLGDLKGLQDMGRACEMLDGGAFNADKAYKDSKLCNILFTRELQRRLQAKDATQNIVANSFSPGLIVGTGLFRDQNPVFTKVFDFAATGLLKVGETPPWGGGCLAYMVDSVGAEQARGQFYNSEPGSSKYGDKAYGVQFGPYKVSKEAQDEAKAKRLWDLTERELGLS